ncbi:DUF1819 family protein [Halochromatium roseum]|uniref:DUF1819 family protein n=1 Tax=Halochromatium roseum TaxID=391920 RepID=UPI001F5CC926|nr:DUF1819 family protein [Halochromatium roseum]
MAFTTGGLLLRETLLVLARFQQLGDWHAARAEALRDNLLQARKASTAKRLVGEVISRLQHLTSEEIAFFDSADAQDQAMLVWVAICRRFRFIADFMADVVRERYLALRNDLSGSDFDAFLDAKQAQHPELAGITPSTRAKLRQVLFKMLREARLLSKDNIILAPTLSRELTTLLLTHQAAAARYFPITEQDLRGIAA